MREQTLMISQEDMDNLARAIAQNVAGRKGPKDTFCKAWPQAREGLSLLRGLLEAVPGAGSFARMAIGIVLAAGDAAEKGVCG